MQHHLLTALLLGLTPSVAMAGWTLDTEHTSVGFKVKHMMVDNVRGHFNELDGSFEFDDKNVEKSSIDVTIKTASIDTNNDKRDKHLRSGDFLLAEEHPEIHFKSKKIKKKRGNNLEVTGDLTIRGVTKEVVLNMEYTDAVTGYGGTLHRGVTASTTIDRYEWGVSFNDTLDNGGVLVGKQVTILIEAALQKPAKK